MGQTTAHDNIVTMFRSGYTELTNQPYLVMEYMSGGSLQDRLENEGVLSLEEAIDVIVPIAQALGFAHTTGIVHKDIKPANILVSATGVPKLSDFGIAALREGTRTGQFAFALAYTAPETFEAREGPNGEIIDLRDERSDLYSLAVTLYTLIVGVAPFSASSDAGLMRQIIASPPRSTKNQALDGFFGVALAKDPADRYPTASHFIEALAGSSIWHRQGGSEREPSSHSETAIAPLTLTDAETTDGSGYATAEAVTLQKATGGRSLQLPLRISDENHEVHPYESGLGAANLPKRHLWLRLSLLFMTLLAAIGLLAIAINSNTSRPDTASTTSTTFSARYASTGASTNSSSSTRHAFSTTISSTSTNTSATFSAKYASTTSGDSSANTRATFSARYASTTAE